jgi:hypothetical protein
MSLNYDFYGISGPDSIALTKGYAGGCKSAAPDQRAGV